MFRKVVIVLMLLAIMGFVSATPAITAPIGFTFPSPAKVVQLNPTVTWSDNETALQYRVCIYSWGAGFWTPTLPCPNAHGPDPQTNCVTLAGNIKSYTVPIQAWDEMFADYYHTIWVEGKYGSTWKKSADQNILKITMPSFYVSNWHADTYPLHFCREAFYDMEKYGLNQMGQGFVISWHNYGLFAPVKNIKGADSFVVTIYHYGDGVTKTYSTTNEFFNLGTVWNSIYAGMNKICIYSKKSSYVLNKHFAMLPRCAWFKKVSY